MGILMMVTAASTAHVTAVVSVERETTVKIGVFTGNPSSVICAMNLGTSLTIIHSTRGPAMMSVPL